MKLGDICWWCPSDVGRSVGPNGLWSGPFEAFCLADKRIAASIRRLVPPLLHFSTISWFLGGLALIAAAGWFDTDARRATGLFVGSLYLGLIPETSRK
jgi:hypothetical protein